jgi:transposase
MSGFAAGQSCADPSVSIKDKRRPLERYPNWLNRGPGWESDRLADLPRSLPGGAMPAAYSYDLRERVVDAVERGSSRRRAAVIFKVSAATVVRWTKRLAETGSFAASATGGDFKSKAVEAHKDWLLATVNGEPDLTLAEIQARLKSVHGLEKSLSCLWRFFDRHQVTFKKNTTRRRAGSSGGQGGA